MNKGKEIVRANAQFQENYRGATVWNTKKKKYLMQNGVVIDNEWYIRVVGSFLLTRLKAIQKRRGVNKQ